MSTDPRELHEAHTARRLGRVLPASIARALAVQWEITRSAFAVRAAPRIAREGERTFEYASESPFRVFLMVYPLLVAIDALVLWAVLPPRLAYVHVVVALLSVQGFVWLLGSYRTMLARPHVLDAAFLHVHRGALASARICLADIESATTLTEGEAAPDAPGQGALRRMDVDGRRVLIVLRSIAACDGARRIVISASDADGLRRAILPVA